MPYVFVGPHPDTLAGGSPLALDQIVRDKDVDLKDPHDADLVDRGWLLEHVDVAAETVVDRKAVAAATAAAAAEKAAAGRAPAERPNSNGEEA